MPSTPQRGVGVPARLADRPRRVLPVTLPLLAIVLTGMLLYTHGYHIDLEVYRLGVATWLAGGDMYGPLPATVSGLALPFIYPPFAAMVLLPLEVLPWTAAWIALYAASVVSVAVTLYVVAAAGLARRWAGRRPVRRLGRAAGGAAAGAGARDVEFGQVNLVLMALVAVDCLAARTRWPRGLLVGIAAAVKLTPAAFVLFFLLRRDRRAAVVAVVTAAAATGLGFAVDPASSARYWFGGPAAGVSGSMFFSNQTIQAMLARAEVPVLAAQGGVARAAVALLALVAPVVRRAEPATALVAVAGFALLVAPPRGRTTGCGSRRRCWSSAREAVRRGSRAWAMAAVCGRRLLRGAVPLDAARAGAGAGAGPPRAGGRGDAT